MHVALEALQVTVLLLYYILEAVVLFFVPTQWRKKDVSGHTVLITGSGSGIGRLMTMEFAQLGCNLVLWDINKELNEETATMARRHASNVHTYTCDLSNRSEIYAQAEKVKTEVGEVDILVNNAGIVTGRPFLDCPDHLIEKTMEVNINAHFWTTKCFLPGMLRRNRGHIVTVASGAGITGVNTLADYCASKFAAVGFDESLRLEISVLPKDGIHTTCVCPYYINTGMFEGVSTRFPHLLPIVEPEYAVSKIMDAILTNQPILFIPRVLYIFFALKNILPTKCVTMLSQFTGVCNSMSDFKGRSKSQ